MIQGRGPVMGNPIRSVDDAFAVLNDGTAEQLDHVMKAITLTRHELNGRVPLIGFAGAPWTVFCYMVQGDGSKTFDKAKAFLYQHPEAARHLCRELSNATIEHRHAQIEACAQAIHKCDARGGL